MLNIIVRYLALHGKINTKMKKQGQCKNQKWLEQSCRSFRWRYDVIWCERKLLSVTNLWVHVHVQFTPKNKPHTSKPYSGVTVLTGGLFHISDGVEQTLMKANKWAVWGWVPCFPSGHRKCWSKKTTSLPTVWWYLVFVIITCWNCIIGKLIYWQLDFPLYWGIIHRSFAPMANTEESPTET